MAYATEICAFKKASFDVIVVVAWPAPTAWLAAQYINPEAIILLGDTIAGDTTAISDVS